MKIYFAVQCHNYQRRLCWSLSSIVQQSIFPFDIIIDVACMRNNGNPSNEKIAEYYNKIGLKTSLTYIDDKDVFARRGFVRNIQIQNAIKTNIDYIYFADADHVFHPDMFRELIKWLKRRGKKHHACIHSKHKVHTSFNSANEAIENSLNELPYIKNSFIRAQSLPTIYNFDKWLLAPGNMQIVSIDDVINLAKGKYTEGEWRLDRHLFIYGQRAWSDHVFRNRIGASKKIRLPLQIHLNHRRDREAKYHLEEQR